MNMLTQFGQALNKRTVILAVLLAGAMTVSAQNYWNGGTGDWTTGANWTAGLPVTSTDARASNGTIQVSSPMAATSGYLRVGGDAAVNMTGGTLALTNMNVGDEAYVPVKGMAQFNLTGGTVAAKNLQVGVGSSGNTGYNGTMVVNGGTLNLSGGVTLGFWGSYGILQLDSGVITVAGTSPTYSSCGILVGYRELTALSHSRLLIYGGCLTNANALQVGYNAQGYGGSVTQTAGYVQCAGFSVDYGSSYVQSGGTNKLTRWSVIGNAGYNNRYELSGSGLLDSSGQVVYFSGAAGTTGTLTQADSASVLKALDLQVGNAGVGYYNLSGGTATLSALVRVGYFSSSQGSTVNQTGGQLTAVGVYLDYGGIYNLSGGTLASSGDIRIGNFAAGNNTFNLSGTGVMDVSANAILVGDNGTTGKTNFLTQTDPGSLLKAAYLTVANRYNGVYTLSNGTALISANLLLGDKAGSTGTVTQTGGTLVSGNVYIGFGAAQATYNMQGGALLSTNANGWFFVGRAAGGSSCLNVSGVSTVKVANIQSDSGIYVADAGVGSVTQTMGYVETPRVAINRYGATGGTATYYLSGGTLSVGANGFYGYSNNDSKMIFNGGKLQAGANLAMTGTVSLVVQGGGVVLDTQGYAVSNALAFTDGVIGGAVTNGLTKLGSGTLTLSGVNTYLGATTVSNGTLQLTKALALPSTTTLKLAPGATVDLAFTGTNVIQSLTVNGWTFGAGVYGASRLPGIATGTGYLKASYGPIRGTLIRVF